jgi:uncharacterized membrane protein
MSVGGVFQRAFSTIVHNPAVVIGIAAVIGAAPSVVMNLAARSITGGSAPSLLANESKIWGVMAFSWILAAVIGAVVQGALTRATVADYEGHRASFGECIAAAVRVLLPLIGAGLIFAVAIMIGMFLLVVPGIIIMLMWSVAGPAIVVEHDGVMRALSRSAELTKGFRWKILGLFLVLLVVYMLLFVALGVVGLRAMPAMGQGFDASYLIANVITAIVINLLWGTIQPALYLELRQAKEGGSLQDLEQVFA